MFPDERYKHDATFNRVVDQMRQLLRTYHITPSELREASILASTMHMNEHIAPLYILKPGLLDYSSLPALFGGANTSMHDTATGASMKVEGTISGRFQSAKPNQSNVPQEIKPIKWGSTQMLERRNLRKVSDRRVAKSWLSNPRGKWDRNQHMYTKTDRNKQTGDRRKPAPFTDHVYGVEQGTDTQKFRVCTRCGLSNVYVKDTPSAQICSGKRDLRN